MLNGLDFLRQALRDIPSSTKLLIIFIVSMRIISSLFGAKIKGFIGEYIVKKQLKKLPLDKYRVINDVMLKTEEGTTQIDHVVVSVYGVFVIETKHYKGWIHGKEFSQQWIQSIYSKKIKIPNPVKQNYGHVINIKKLLVDYPQISIHSIVVFSGSAVLKNVETTTPVIYANQLKGLILKYNETSKATMNDVEDIVALLTTENIDSFKSKREHVKYVKKIVEEKQEVKLMSKSLQGKDVVEIKEVDSELIRDKDNNAIGKSQQFEEPQKCGFCDGTLVRRNGKRGAFLGCSNFPKCRFTTGIEIKYAEQ